MALVAAAMLAGAAGCASVTTGTSQTLTIDTIPSGADCTLTREGLVIGRVNPTPVSIAVQRTRNNISVTCTKSGYQEATYLNKSGLEGATFGNVILGGLVGVAVDAASGANNKYDPKMSITLLSSATAESPAPPSQDASLPPETIQQGEQAARTERYSSPVAEFHCPEPGTIIRTSSQTLLKFVDGTGFRCNYLDESGASHQRYAVFVDGLGQFARKDLDGLWPVKVGNKVSFEIIEASPTATSAAKPNDPSGKEIYTEGFSVVGRESIKVPAGTFDTFVVEWREKAARSGTEAVIVLWYAPKTGYVVKSAVRIVTASAVDPYATSRYSAMSYEVMEVTAPKGAP